MKYYPYLIEPYNAYAKGKKRQKHWTEIMEEEALYHKMVQDAILQETKEQTAQQQTQNVAMVAAGAGGVPPYNYFQETIEYALMSISPSTAVAPAQITFTNNTRTPDDDTFLWIFDTGSLTSTLVTPPTLVYRSVGTFNIMLQETSSAGTMTTASAELILTEPTITASYTATSASTIGPVTLSFSGSATQTSQYPITPTWLWTFWSGTTQLGQSSSVNVSRIYESGSSYTASLTATNLFSSASVYLTSWSVASPTLTATLTVTTNSNVAPMTASYTASYTYNGHGTVEGTVYDIEGGSRVFTTNPMEFIQIQQTGSFTASFSVTESTYNIMDDVYTTPFSASAPSLFSLSLLVTTSSNNVPMTASYTASLGYDGHGTLAAKLWYKEGNYFSYTATSGSPMEYDAYIDTASVYTASLSVTESTYNIMSAVFGTPWSASDA